MLTWLRRIASCFFVTLAILFTVLWVRSYYYFGSVEKRDWANYNCTWRPAGTPSTEASVTRFRIANGTAIYISEYNSKAPASIERRWGTTYSAAHPTTTSSSFGLEREIYPGGIYFTMLKLPIWFIASLTVILTIAIRPKPRFKFGLRDLFTLTTVAALTIGPLAFWLRSIG